MNQSFIKYSAIAVFAFYLAFGAVACPNQQTSDESYVSRVNAVKGNSDTLDYRKWCDLVFSQDQAPRLALPSVEAVGKQTLAPTLPARRWVWVNLWATWCKPCVREMPMLQLWRDQLAKLGQTFDLWFVSVDQDKAELEGFLLNNPQLTAGNTFRLVSAESMEPWLRKFGVNAMASVPIHIIAAPGGGVRCVRTGSLNDGDFSIVKNLVR